VSALEEELLHVVGEHTSGDLHLHDGVGDREALEDGDSVGDTVSGVADETSGTSSGVKGEDGLDLDGAVLHAEGLEHNLEHFLSVVLGVSGSLSEHDGVELGGVLSQLVVEDVVPHLLHVLPGLDDTRGDGVLKVQDTLLLHGLITNILGLLVSSKEGSLIFRSSDDGGENTVGGFVASNTGLDHTGTVINNDDLFSFHMC